MRRCFSTATNYFEIHLKNELAGIKNAGTFKNERVIQGKQGVLVKVTGSDKPVINFCANNYLGSRNPWSWTLVGPFHLWNQDIHKELEQKIAKFHGTEDTILYAACFDANGGIFEVMTGEQDTIISDELNHASIIDGIRLSKAKRLRYKHLDLDDLETKLKESKESRFRLIVTDGVFSMDGDVAPLADISSLAEQYDTLLFIDECHATGFFGKTGRGTAEAVGGNPHVINSTLGKALGGSMGGYTTGPKPLIDLLRQRSRPYLFSNSLAPSIVGSSIKVFDLLMNDSSFIGSLQTNVAHFRKSMAANGFTILGNDPTHPICPVLLGDAKLAATMADELLKLGIYVIGFSFPVVPKGKARIRVQISAAHSKEHIDQLIDAFAKVGKKLNVV
ncbi:Protein CBG17650 [Caenorhabditis briggsae]|uniref:Protein CBG17650 n=1 Tax=Caenorhabditis briggsae TaxID=6238 RepID=A8XRL9_CAEBR|nr:Protein CBG17650 [Caenorhabditis briggsae]CAP35293.2 Protein CBG17650 [Caenorhabditis briggsae]